MMEELKFYLYVILIKSKLAIGGYGYHMKQAGLGHTGSPQHLFGLCSLLEEPALFLAELNLIILKTTPKFCF